MFVLRSSLKIVKDRTIKNVLGSAKDDRKLRSLLLLLVSTFI